MTARAGASDPDKSASELAELAAEVAHDLNNLLSVVRVNAQLARMHPSGDGLDDRLADIEQAAVEAAELVNGLASEAARLTGSEDSEGR